MKSFHEELTAQLSKPELILDGSIKEPYIQRNIL